MVPASLADTAAAAACDEALALLLPQLRDEATHLLQQLRPAALQALQDAQAVPLAWAAGEELLLQLQPLQQQLQPRQPQLQPQQPQQQQVLVLVGGWLQKLQEALPGLGYGPRQDTKLLQAVLHGLSLIAAAAAAAGGGGGLQGPVAEKEAAAISTAAPAGVSAAGDSSVSCSWPGTTQRVGDVLECLLRHQSSSVRQTAWQLLRSAVAAAQHDSSSSRDGGRQPPAVVQLLLLPQVLECLVVEQQGVAGPEAAAAAAAAELLTGLLRCGGAAVAQRLLPWRPWITSTAAGDANSSSSSRLNAALASFLDQQGLVQGSRGAAEPREQGFWTSRLAAVLQDLFSVDGGVRRAAGRGLLLLLTAGAEGEEQEQLGPEELQDFAGEWEGDWRGLAGQTGIKDV